MNPYRRELANRHALEIGGPTPAFSDSGALPIYKILARVDNCQFSTETIWTGKVVDSFQYHSQKPIGSQFISEGADLKQVESSTYDCVIASHCLEHMANPLKALAEWKRVLKKSGILLVLLPDKSRTFDWHRPVTKLEHMIEDYGNNVGEDDLSHLNEILQLHDLSKDKDAGTSEQFSKRCKENFSYRVMHHHTFTLDSALALVAHAGFEVLRRDVFRPFDISILARKPVFMGDGRSSLLSSPLELCSPL
jgi:SAM-dependent methyltransferase